MDFKEFIESIKDVRVAKRVGYPIEDVKQWHAERRKNGHESDPVILKKEMSEKKMSEKPENCLSIIVKNLSYDTTEDALWPIFEPCGEIERLNLLKDKDEWYNIRWMKSYVLSK